jgi:hypothetical protein
MKKYFLILIIFISFACLAAVYQKENTNGAVTYSDVPIAGSSQIGVEEGNIINHNSLPANNQTDSNGLPRITPQTQNQVAVGAPTTPNIAAPAQQPYKRFEINFPLDQQTFQKTSKVPITLAIDPQLQNDNLIQIFLDGRPISAASTETQFQLDNLEIGKHEIYAILIDAQKTLLKQSKIITIFIKGNVTPTAATQ